MPLALAVLCHFGWIFLSVSADPLFRDFTGLWGSLGRRSAVPRVILTAEPGAAILGAFFTGPVPQPGSRAQLLRSLMQAGMVVSFPL